MRHTTPAAVYDNTLTSRLADDMRTLLAGDDEQPWPLPAREYLAAALRWSEEIVRTCEQLAFIPLYIEDFRPGPAHRAVNLTEHEHIRFFLESYCIKACSAYEKCLHLLNHVHRVGLDETRLSFQKILVRIGGTECQRHLDAIWELVRGHSELRNTVIHRRHFSDAGLDDLATLDLIAGMRTDVTYRLGYNLAAGDYRNKALEHCNSSNQALFGAIRLLLDACAPHYVRELAALNDPTP